VSNSNTVFDCKPLKQDKETLELRPEIGWAIRDTGKQGIKDDDANYKDEILNPFEPVIPK
jgi:hypothetical protein